MGEPFRYIWSSASSNELSAMGERRGSLMSNLLRGISKMFSMPLGWNSGLGGGALGNGSSSLSGINTSAMAIAVSKCSVS